MSYQSKPWKKTSNRKLAATLLNNDLGSAHMATLAFVSKIIIDHLCWDPPVKNKLSTEQGKGHFPPAVQGNIRSTNSPLCFFCLKYNTVEQWHICLRNSSRDANGDGRYATIILSWSVQEFKIRGPATVLFAFFIIILFFLCGVWFSWCSHIYHHA